MSRDAAHTTILTSMVMSVIIIVLSQDWLRLLRDKIQTVSALPPPSTMTVDQIAALYTAPATPTTTPATGAPSSGNTA